MTYHDTDIDAADVEMSRAQVAHAPVTRWIEQGGAPAVAVAEISSILIGDQPAAAADRCERLYSGLYAAWQHSWGIRPGARLQLQEILNRLELEAVRAWLSAPNAMASDARPQLQRLLRLVACCHTILNRIRGRRPGTRRSARDMSLCHPEQPYEAAERARYAMDSKGYYSHGELREDQARYARDLARIRAAEAALAAEDLPDDLEESDVMGEASGIAAFRAEVYKMRYGRNAYAIVPKPSKRKAVASDREEAAYV